MAIISTLDFDSFAEAATVAPSAPWSTNGVAPTATSAAAAHGARGARWASTAAAGRVQYDTGADQTGAHVLSWYMYIRDYASVNHYIAGVRSLTTGGTSQGDVRINTNHTVSLRNAANVAVATSSAMLAEDTLYRCEWRVHQTAGTQELMKVVRLRIVTLQAEGVHVQTLLSSDIVIPTINDALDLFIDEQRLVATLRK